MSKSFAFHGDSWKGILVLLTHRCNNLTLTEYFFHWLSGSFYHTRLNTSFKTGFCNLSYLVTLWLLSIVYMVICYFGYSLLLILVIWLFGCSLILKQFFTYRTLSDRQEFTVIFDNNFLTHQVLSVASWKRIEQKPGLCLWNFETANLENFFSRKREPFGAWFFPWNTLFLLLLFFFT